MDQTAPVFAVQKFFLNFQNVSFGAILASPRVPIFRPVPLSSAWFLSPAGARLEPEPRSAGDKRLPSEQPVTCCRGHELKRAADSLLAPNQATTLGPCWGQTKIRPPGAAPRPGASPPPPLTPWGQPAEKICFYLFFYFFLPFCKFCAFFPFFPLCFGGCFFVFSFCFFFFPELSKVGRAGWPRAPPGVRGGPGLICGEEICSDCIHFPSQHLIGKSLDLTAWEPAPEKWLE